MKRTIPIERFKVIRAYRETANPISWWGRLKYWFRNEVYRKVELFHFDIEIAVRGNVKILDILQLENGVEFYVFNVYQDLSSACDVVQMKTIRKTTENLFNTIPHVITITKRINE